MPNLSRSIETPKGSYAEALSYFPEPEDFVLGPEDYLEQIRKVKAAVAVPVIGSLNEITEGGWLRYARLIEQAGADGLELNLYELALDLGETGAEVERRGLEVVRAVKGSVAIPVAVTLSPFYSSTGNFARRRDEAGADALVLFNHFYQPEIDVEEQELLRVNLCSPTELLLRVRWIGALSGHIRASLAATGGVHTAIDVVKAVMAGVFCDREAGPSLHDSKPCSGASLITHRRDQKQRHEKASHAPEATMPFPTRKG